MSDLRIVAHPYQIPGKVALLRAGMPVWFGDIGAPWDGVDCDTIIVADTDYDRIKAAFPTHPKRAGDDGR